jgi:hypothetical protein
MNLTDIVTKQDLLQVKDELLNALKEITSSNDTKSKKWLRSGEVQEILSISSSSLQSLRISGTLPYTKLSGVYYYDYNDISEILLKNKKK